jgi:micrococcal nuclease
MTGSLFSDIEFLIVLGIGVGLFLFLTKSEFGKRYFSGKKKKEKLKKYLISIGALVLLLIGNTFLFVEEGPVEDVFTPTEEIIFESPNIHGRFFVTRVVDGDTIKVLIDGDEESVRLIGVDTPETVHPNKPVECFGKEASAYVKKELEGTYIGLEEDSSQGDVDGYDRLLRYIFTEDGMNFNEILVFEGYAYEYTYDTPYMYQEEFKKAQEQAQLHERGLWADGVCED